MADPASVRARARIRAEMEKKHLSQRDVAGILAWSQSRVSKNLNARVEMSVDDLEGLCFAVGISLTEAVRDHGLEFCAEMTPMELRTLELLRALPQPVFAAFLDMLSYKSNVRVESRGSTKTKPTIPKGRGAR